ncbi:MAG: hypothetical protein ABEJ95_05065 [Candidatus Nanohalobium sp.]
MKRTIYLATLVLLTGLSTAVVGADCPPGQPCITGVNGDQEDGKTITRNGTDWQAEMTVKEIGPAESTAGNISNASYGENSVKFQGSIGLTNSCMKPDFTVTERNGTYMMRLETVKTGGKDTACAPVIEKASYSMNFSAETPFTLNVKQGNISESFSRPDYQTGSSTEKKSTETRGVLSDLINWISTLL